MYGIYARISQEGDRTPAEVEEQLDIYEAECRSLAMRKSVRVSDEHIVRESDVSGAKAVRERGLEGLLLAVEAGELEGVLAPNSERFARDMIEGCLAMKRVMDAGGRLIFGDGIDSSDPAAVAFFQMRMIFAEDYIRRTRDQFRSRNERAAARGVWLYHRPYGYAISEERMLSKHPREATVVVELYKRRAEGVNVGKLYRWMKSDHGYEGTVYGVRSILSNRAYVGEMRIPSGKKGEPRIIRNHHIAILTEAQWQAAQLKGTYHPRDGSHAAGAKLSGLVYCAGCGRRVRNMMGGGSTHYKKRFPSYTCTKPDCQKRAGIARGQLEAYVQKVLDYAISSGAPETVAVLAGREEYAKALEAVAQAQTDLETYRDSLEIQRELSTAEFAAGLRLRKDALQAARDQLTAARRTGNADWWQGKTKTVSLAEFLHEDERQRYGRFIDRIVLHSGRGVPVEARTEIWLMGATEPYRLPESDVAVLATALDTEQIAALNAEVA